jgi:hypothetical protein
MPPVCTRWLTALRQHSHHDRISVPTRQPSYSCFCAGSFHGVIKCTHIVTILACSPRTVTILACSPRTVTILACSPRTVTILACSPRTHTHYLLLAFKCISVCMYINFKRKISVSFVKYKKAKLSL